MRQINVTREEGEKLVDLIEKHSSYDQSMLDLSDEIRREFGMSPRDVKEQFVIFSMRPMPVRNDNPETIPFYYVREDRGSCVMSPSKRQAMKFENKDLAMAFIAMLPHDHPFREATAVTSQL